MAKTVIVRLTDDIDGGDADETVHFALDGRSYEIDVSAANAARLREALKPFIEKGQGCGRSGRTPGATLDAAGTGRDRRMYSQLKDDEKARFRAWAEHGDGPADQRRPGEELDRRRPAVARDQRAGRHDAPGRSWLAELRQARESRRCCRGPWRRSAETPRRWRSRTASSSAARSRLSAGGMYQSGSGAAKRARWTADRHRILRQGRAAGRRPAPARSAPRRSERIVGSNHHLPRPTGYFLRLSWSDEDRGRSSDGRGAGWDIGCRREVRRISGWHPPGANPKDPGWYPAGTNPNDAGLLGRAALEPQPTLERERVGRGGWRSPEPRPVASCGRRSHPDRRPIPTRRSRIHEADAPPRPRSASGSCS